MKRRIRRPAAWLVLASALLLGMSSPVLFGQDRDVSPRRQPCMVPIKYRLGALDPRFGISRETFRRRVEDAADVWGAAAGRELFSYDERGVLQIDLVFDGRQEATQRLIAVRASIADKLKDADQVKAQLLPLQSRFRVLEDAYSDQASAYQRALDSHNKAVLQSNQKGGALTEEYNRLGGEAQALRKQEAMLGARQLEIKNLVDDINGLVRTHNAILDRANAEANALNKSGAVGTQFEQGRYLRQDGEERIEIYEYEGETALVVILAHEMGHALGVRHNANPSSIMSPLVHVKTPVLTAEDMEGLKAACSLR